MPGNFREIIDTKGENMDKPTPLRKNPSRENCEKTIKRILMTEVLQEGTNQHFRSAADFMDYFESLYPASPGLTKQVQRAIKALDMPRNEEGYFIVNKTTAQFEQEKEISRLFETAHVSVDPMESYETVFLSVDKPLKSYLVHILETSETFREKFLTLVETSNGILIYTQNKNSLLILLNSLTI